MVAIPFEGTDMVVGVNGVNVHTGALAQDNVVMVNAKNISK